LVDYEGLFLLDSSRSARDWDGVVEHVRELLTKNGAEIVECKKWGERRLAYEIKHHRRGVYLLVHFRAPGRAVGRIKRECGLSDTILRTLVTLYDPDAVCIGQIDHGEEKAAVGAPKAAPAKVEGKPAEAAGEAKAEPAAEAPAEPVTEAPAEAEKAEGADEKPEEVTATAQAAAEAPAEPATEPSAEKPAEEEEAENGKSE